MVSGLGPPLTVVSTSSDGRLPDPVGSLSVQLHRILLEGVGALRSTRERIDDRETIVVEVVDPEGRSGWGECPALPRPGYSAEYLEGCWTALRSVFVPMVTADPVGAPAALSSGPGHEMARGALIGALADLSLRSAGRSLAAALADDTGPATRVVSNAVVGIHDDPGELESAVDRALRAGHRGVKLKIDPAHGVDAVRTVRRVWPELDLSIDANGSYPDAEAALAELGRIERIAGTLGYVEQPLAADDLVGSAIVARRLTTPVALDESLTTVGSAATALALGALGAANVKPSRVGGPFAALSIARLLVDAGVEVFCGGMVESGIGRATALAFAAQRECTLPTDLGPSSRYHRRDVTRPFELDDGMLEVPTGPGIGVAPDRGVLAEATVERWVSG